MGNTIIIAINMNNSNALQRSAAWTYIYGGADPSAWGFMVPSPEKEFTLPSHKQISLPLSLCYTDGKRRSYEQYTKLRTKH